MRTKVKIIKLEHNKYIPRYQTEGSSGMDLHAAIDEPILLNPLERALIPTGLKIELPKDFEAQVRARSGLAIKHGVSLINAIGTIDEDYRGEICVGVVNLSNEPYTINPDERIAQMVFAKVEKVELEVAEELTSTTRAEGGFGSTGK